MSSFKTLWKKHVNIPDLLLSLGVDLDAPALADTPERVANAWEELLQGYTLDADDILETTFESEGHGPVMCRNIEFSSVCEHHMIPFFGECFIAYIPGDVVVGLSKLTRLVDCFAQRLQIQERLTLQICDALTKSLKPSGVLVVTQARHLCCLGRGVRRTKMDFVCSSQSGEIYAPLYNLLLRGA